MPTFSFPLWSGLWWAREKLDHSKRENFAQTEISVRRMFSRPRSRFTGQQIAFIVVGTRGFEPPTLPGDTPKRRKELLFRGLRPIHGLTLGGKKNEKFGLSGKGG